MEVAIFMQNKGVVVPIVRCPQRELFRKNNWPAKGKIVAALQEFQEEFSSR